MNLRSIFSTVVLATGAVLAACEPAPAPANFVGTWKSSRSTNPLILHANGDWEIRDSDDRVLQYGGWQLRGRTLIWSIKLDRQLQQDPNAIVSMQADGFELRESNGSVRNVTPLKNPSFR